MKIDSIVFQGEWEIGDATLWHSSVDFLGRLLYVHWLRVLTDSKLRPDRRGSSPGAARSALMVSMAQNLSDLEVKSKAPHRWLSGKADFER